jgi:hypothetical protein
MNPIGTQEKKLLIGLHKNYSYRTCEKRSLIPTSKKVPKGTRKEITSTWKFPKRSPGAYEILIGVFEKTPIRTFAENITTGFPSKKLSIRSFRKLFFEIFVDCLFFAIRCCSIFLGWWLVKIL